MRLRTSMRFATSLLGDPAAQLSVAAQEYIVRYRVSPQRPLASTHVAVLRIPYPLSRGAASQAVPCQRCWVGLGDLLHCAMCSMQRAASVAARD